MTIFRFKSKQFDISAEPANDYNPICGHALAETLRTAFKSRGYCVMDSIECEDWGWYFDTTIGDESYTVGTCTYADMDPDTDRPIYNGETLEHLVQFDKARTFRQMLFGKNKLTPEDPIFDVTEKIIRETVKDIADFEREDA